MWVAWCLFVVACGLYLVTATLTARDSGRGAFQVFCVAAGSIVAFFVAYRWREISVHETLLTASLALVFMLLLTRGRPARMFDPKPPDSSGAELSDEERGSFRRRKRLAHLHQIAFIAVGVVFLCWYELTEATFLT